MLLSFVIGLIILVIIVTHFAIYSVQTQSTRSSMRTHPKTRGGASLKVLALLLSLISVMFFFLVSFFLCILCLHKCYCVLLLVLLSLLLL
jgi:quinol-cytochrome oxidoreductase complex cytochrome b subunit